MAGATKGQAMVKTIWTVAAAAAVVAAAASAASIPVGPLPAGVEQRVNAKADSTFRVTLPKPGVAGGTWRVARAYDGKLVTETGEGDLRNGGVWVEYRALAPGKTDIVFAVTRGETRHAYAARTYHVVIANAPGACPTDALPLPSNAIGPAVQAALAADSPRNKPLVTGASLATADTVRGPEVKRLCGPQTWRRTVVVYITDRTFLPSASLAERVYFVDRTASGFGVWQRVH
jgi:hypothetical protein